MRQVHNLAYLFASAANITVCAYRSSFLDSETMLPSLFIVPEDHAKTFDSPALRRFKIIRFKIQRFLCKLRHYVFCPVNEYGWGYDFELSSLEAFFCPYPLGGISAYYSATCQG